MAIAAVICFAVVWWFWAIGHDVREAPGQSGNMEACAQTLAWLRTGRPPAAYVDELHEQ